MKIAGCLDIKYKHLEIKIRYNSEKLGFKLGSTLSAVKR